MLEALKPGMTKPVVTRCPDGHFRRIIYGLATYIADYPEQALLSCIVQSWCAKQVFIVIITVCIANTQIRCTARSNNLDSDPHALLRSREHTNTLVEVLELGTLWDEYGLVGDVVVRIVSVL